MSYKDDVGDRLKMDVNNWPHQFTKTYKEFQIGVDEFGDKLLAVEMTCIHCNARYISGKETRPPDPCPARNKTREMKRLLS